MRTRKGYITKGVSGWTVAFWNGPEVRYLHGFSCWRAAFNYLRDFWACPPDYQDGFPTVVRLTND